MAFFVALVFVCPGVPYSLPYSLPPPLSLPCSSAPAVLDFQLSIRTLPEAELVVLPWLLLADWGAHSVGRDEALELFHGKFVQQVGKATSEHVWVAQLRSVQARMHLLYPDIGVSGVRRNPIGSEMLIPHILRSVQAVLKERQLFDPADDSCSIGDLTTMSAADEDPRAFGRAVLRELAEVRTTAADVSKWDSDGRLRRTILSMAQRSKLELKALRQRAAESIAECKDKSTFSLAELKPLVAAYVDYLTENQANPSVTKPTEWTPAGQTCVLRPKGEVKKPYVERTLLPSLLFCQPRYDCGDVYYYL